MAFYHGTEIRDKALIRHREGQEYSILDDMAVPEFFRDNCGKDTKTFVTAFLGNESFFGQDLNQVPALTDAVAMEVASGKKFAARQQASMIWLSLSRA